jgi:hypothetical protein
MNSGWRMVWGLVFGEVPMMCQIGCNSYWHRGCIGGGGDRQDKCKNSCRVYAHIVLNWEAMLIWKGCLKINETIESIVLALYFM